MIMNEEILKRLEPYKAMLKTAARTNCVHGLAVKTTQELFDIAAQLNVRHGNVNCPKCVLKTCIELGKLIMAEEQRTAEAAKADDSEKLIQEPQKVEDNKTIKKEKTINQKSHKQPQKANKKKVSKK